MQLEPGTLLDRYRIDGVLGVGGMAIVYRASHVRLGTPVALKVLTFTAPTVQARLLAEGRAQAALRHPNIVTVFDVIEVNGSPGLVMELVEGPSLAALLESRRLSLDQADALAQGILAGVEAAHAAGLIHRDIKPGNVLIEVRPDGLRPKVTDFGLVKALDASSPDLGMSQTRSGMGMGTPAYMAPEQLRDARTVDARADVFSLGAVLYEIVTGRQAFEGGHLMAVYQAAASGRYVPPEELVPDLPERMALAIRGALQPEVDARIPSVATLRARWGGLAAAPDPNVTLVGPWDPGMLVHARVLAGNTPPPTTPHAVLVAPTVGRDPSITEVARELPVEDGPSISRATPTGASPIRTGETFIPDSELAPAAGPDEPTAPTDAFGPPPPRSRGPWLALAAALVLGTIAVGSLAGLALLGALPLPWSASGGSAPASAAAEAGAPSPSVAADVLGADGIATDPAPPEGEVAAASSETTPPEPATGAATDPSAPPPLGVEPTASPSPTQSDAPRTADASSARTTRGSAGGPTTTPSPDRTAVVAPEPPGPTARAADPASTGKLVVNSVPYPDHVQLDGGANLPPRIPADVPAGKHQLTIQASDGRTTTQSVVVEAGARLVFCWNFDTSKPCDR